MRFFDIGWRLPFFIWRTDILYVGWMGHHLVPIIRLLSGKPIIFDLQAELHDALCEDRKLCAHGSVMCRLARFLDTYVHTRCDVIIAHDLIHARRLREMYQVPPEKLVFIPMCADTKLFFRQPQRKQPQDAEKFLIDFCGEFSPAHGVEYILRAAKLLEDTHIHFRIAGKGQLSLQITALFEELRPKNVELIPRRLSDEELVEHRSSADLCLGSFGSSKRLYWSLTNKAFETIAMARPLLTAGPPQARAVAEFFTDCENAFLCAAGDANMLAEKIRWIVSHPEDCKRIAENGYQYFRNLCNDEAQEERVLGAVDKALSGL